MAGMIHSEIMDRPETNILRDLGISFVDVPVEVDARVLDEPMDTYSFKPGTLAQPCETEVEYIIVDLRESQQPSIIRDVEILTEKLYNTLGLVFKFFS